MTKSTFREWTLDSLDTTFGLRQIRSCAKLDAWLASEYTPSTFEREYLLGLQKSLIFGVDHWNEVELENKFISPLIVFVNFDHYEFDNYANVGFSYFLERELKATIGEYELIGQVDGMIATGFRNPHQPYFCLNEYINEYKRQLDPTGDPIAQALVAMLVAQELNQHKHPIFGSYIVGRDWFFMRLEEKNYCISQNYSANKDEIFDIFRILQGLKQMILKMITN